MHTPKCKSALLSVRTQSWKTIKDLHNLWKNKNSLKNKSLTQEDDDTMTLNCPLLSSRDHTEKDVHFQLRPLPPLFNFVCIVGNLSFLQVEDILCGCPTNAADNSNYHDADSSFGPPPHLPNNYYRCVVQSPWSIISGSNLQQIIRL